ncbi:MAG: hypothetical protein CSA33_00900 [Desulfobulbus propionicus]|nr:MAG: hypothetical protein CSA33_00900 [Desulfobulbus propionicus]
MMRSLTRIIGVLLLSCAPYALLISCTEKEETKAVQPTPAALLAESNACMETSAPQTTQPEAREHSALQPNVPPPTSQTAPDSKEEKQDMRPQIAVIIDDMGYHQWLGKKLIALNLDLTFSFLPNAQYTRELAYLAHHAKKDILIHLPMEPKSKKWNPGRDALMSNDSPGRIREKTDQFIRCVPYAIGANNHMGSLFTEQVQAMRDVLTILNQHDLFFIDSFTTAGSVGLSQAQAMHIPTARRHVFLDNIRQTKQICNQFDQLVQLAWKQGSAIGIGHPNKETLQALSQCVPPLLQSVHLVGVHKLVH